MGFLRDFKITAAKGRTTITFQDNILEAMTTYSVPAAGFPGLCCAPEPHASHVRYVGAPKVHSTGDKKEQGGMWP